MRRCFLRLPQQSGLTLNIYKQTTTAACLAKLHVLRQSGDCVHPALQGRRINATARVIGSMHPKNFEDSSGSTLEEGQIDEAGAFSAMGSV